MNVRHRLFTSRHAGFTLLELLVAVAIFAIVGVMAMSGLHELIQNRTHAGEIMARTREVQKALTRMEQDFMLLIARPIRDATSTATLGALVSGTDGNNLVEFTRSGWSNPTGLSRPTLQRLRYRLTGGKLYRAYWGVLDRTLNSPAIEVPLLEKVSAAKLRYLDANHQWQTTWPMSTAVTAPSNPSVAARVLPLAIELTLTLEDWGEVTRIIEVPTL